MSKDIPAIQPDAVRLTARVTGGAALTPGQDVWVTVTSSAFTRA